MNIKKQINIIGILTALAGVASMLFGVFSGMETIARGYNNILYSAVIPLVFGFLLIEISKDLRAHKNHARISLIIISTISIIAAPIWLSQTELTIALIDATLSIWFLTVLFNKEAIKLFK